MLDDDSPGLGVGFAIDIGGMEELTRLQAMMDTTEMRVVQEAKSIERATKGMLDLSGATASITTFGNAATRALGTAEADMKRAEKAAESLSKGLTRQAETFGMTRAGAVAFRAATAGATDAANELLAAEAALTALKTDARLATEAQAARDQAAAEAAVNAQLLERSRLQAALERNTGVGRVSATDAGATYSALAARAAEDEAREALVAAAATKQLAEEHQRLAGAVQGSHDAQMADAAAAERLRETTDPLYAATKRLNAEIAESTRLYHAGATGKAEYERQQEVLTQRVQAATAIHEANTVAVGKNAFALKEVGLQLPDIFEGLTTGQKPMQVFIQQGSQIAQIAMMAEGGVKGLAAQIAILSLRFAPLIVMAGVAFGAIKLFQQQVKEDGDLTRFRDGLGLTHKEMLQLSDGVDKAGDKITRLSGVTVTAGDVLAGFWKALTERAGDGSGWQRLEAAAVSAFKGVLNAWSVASDYIYAGIYGTFDAVRTVWSKFPAVFGDLFVSGVNVAIGALNGLVKAGIDQINTVLAAANKLPGIKVGAISAPQIAPIDNANAGAAAAAAKQIGDSYTRAYADGRKADAAFWKQVGDNSRQHAKDRMTEEAAAIKANQTPKTDRHAERLEREAEAIEAQIRNLYKLADAYGVSGAAALIAEAREKAESKAIKERGDVEAAVDRQVRLAIAQRVSDAEKSAMASNNQAEAQERVNALVQAGLVPSARAAEMVRDQLADLPLLQAVQAAQQRGLSTEAARATKALEDQRAARERSNAAAQQAQFISAIQGSTDELERLQQEVRLIGAATDARVHDMAVLKAWQDAQRQGMPVDQALAYVTAQVKIADQTQANTHAQAAYNDSLTLTADKWDIIAGKVQSAASGMADAFGDAGRAIGGVAEVYANFQASRSRADAEHEKAIKAAGGNEALKAQENAKYALRSSGAQIEAYGDMAAAAKGFFKEGSAGYQALGAVEKAFRVAQLAMSIQAMVQNAAETLGFVTGSAARATAAGAEGVARQAKLPFPANIAAMAATAAALVAAGVAVFGGGGGGAAVAPTSSADLQKATGIGTVLGSPDAQSASIAHSLDLVAKNTGDNLGLGNAMLTSLKAINTSIVAMSAVVGKQISVSGSLGDTTKLNIGASGNGGFLGLFASSTTRSLYDAGITLAATTVGNIVADGISGQTYQIVQQVKKSSGFLGIGGSTKTSYQTTTGALPSDISASIQSVLGALETGIVTAAGTIGVEGAKKMLDGFTVNIGKLSFNGLDAQGIQDQLNAVFSSVGDKMVEAILPGIEKFQTAGEGLFETLERVASTVVAVDAEMAKLGTSTTGLGIDIDMGIASQFDSVSDFTSAADAYFQSYYSAAEQAAAKTAQLGKVFDSLGLTMPGTMADFRNLVQAQDLTTAAGQATYATLLQIAPAFADLKTSMDGAKNAADVLSERDGLQKQLWQALGDTASLRASELAALDPSNRALQQRIYDLADEQAATDAATKAAQDAASAEAALASTRTGLENQILQLTGDTATQRQRELAALDPSLRSLQQRIYALTDEKAASDAATQAAQTAAAADAALAQQRTGLEGQILQLQGNTAEIRNRELAALDPSLRALQMRVYALTDEQAATAAATQASQEAAQAAEAIAQQRAGLQSQLWTAEGNTVASRQAELDALDESNKGLQLAIWRWQDAATASQDAAQAAQEQAQKADAIVQERAGLQQQLWQAEGNTVALRQAELDALDDSNKGIQLAIWRWQDGAAAAQAAADAAAATAQAEQALAQERQGLMQQLWQLTGDTASIRAAQLASLDPANRALQEQIYAITDAQDAAKAADTLREAWASVGSSIMDEVKRIRGLTDTATGGGSIASLLGQFNAATAAARAGDQDAAKSLPDLSKSLLDAAALAATSRQELARVQAQTAASLEQTYGLVTAGLFAANDDGTGVGAAGAPAAASGSGDEVALLRQAVVDLTAKVDQLRQENNQGHAATAGNTGKSARILDAVTGQSGGDAIATVAAAA